MATFTTTTTVGQDAAIAEAVVIQNARDATALTAAQFFDAIARAAVTTEVQNLRSFKATQDRQAAAAAYSAATPAVQAQVRTLLGL